MLDVQNLTLSYLYGAEALRDVSFSLQAGEKVAVLAGEEGGKTSLLKCIAGLTPAKTGKIFWQGQEITKAHPKKRDFAVIYQNEGIFPFRSVYFHLKYPLKLRGVKKEERHRRVVQTAERFGLFPVLNGLGRQLYDDDKIRLSFARGLIRKPPLLLVDNSFVVLKEGEREALFAEMLAFLREAEETAVLFATDSPSEAFTVGERVVVLHYGQAVQTGTPAEILSSPATLAVDEMVNRYNARRSFVPQKDEKGYFVEVLGQKFRFSWKNGEEGNVIASYEPKEQENGVCLKSVGFRYIHGGFYAELEDGTLLKTNIPLKKEYFVGAKNNKVNFYDSVTEKAIG